MEDIVSLVVVTYNSSETILETLDSIYEQTYKRIELIICDDESKDETVIVCREWCKEKQDRFVNYKIVSHENVGVTKNIKIGIENANGKFIQLFAGDDILLPNAIQMKVEFANMLGLDLLFCRVRPFGEEKEMVEKMKEFCDRGYKIIEAGYREQRKNIIINNFIAGPSGGFYRTDFIKNNNIYDERYPMLEDYPFIYHYVLSGGELFLINEELALYRVSGSSLCGKKLSPASKCQMEFFFKERFKMLIKEKMYLEVIKQLTKNCVKKVVFMILR